MLAALNRGPTPAPEEVLGNVRKSVDAFVLEAEQFDDLTMLCIQYHGREREKDVKCHVTERKDFAAVLKIRKEPVSFD